MSGSENGGSQSHDSRKRWRDAIVTFFPMAIAVLSLLTSFYNGYLNNKFVTLIQGNLTRAEYMRTRRDAIDSYFQVKYRSDVVAREAASGGVAPAKNAVNATAAAGTTTASGQGAARPPTTASIEAGNAVARFGALATYLANMRDEKTRAAYTDLYWKLDEYAAMSATSTPQDRARVIGEADKAFARLNDDCVRNASRQP